jgi:hypothetical protein
VDGQRWRGAVLLTAEPAGNYTVVCTASRAAAGVTLSAGEPPRFRGPRAQVITMLAAFGLAATGLLVGLIVALAGGRRQRTTA